MILHLLLPLFVFLHHRLIKVKKLWVLRRRAISVECWSRSAKMWFSEVYILYYGYWFRKLSWRNLTPRSHPSLPPPPPSREWVNVCWEYEKELNFIFLWKPKGFIGITWSNKMIFAKKNSSMRLKREWWKFFIEIFLSSFFEMPLSLKPNLWIPPRGIENKKSHNHISNNITNKRKIQHKTFFYLDCHLLVNCLIMKIKTKKSWGEEWECGAKKGWKSFLMFIFRHFSIQCFYYSNQQKSFVVLSGSS